MLVCIKHQIVLIFQAADDPMCTDIPICDRFHFWFAVIRVEEDGPVRVSYKMMITIYQYCVAVHT